MERALDPNAFELRSLDFLSRSRSEAPVAEELEEDIFTCYPQAAGDEVVRLLPVIFEY